MVAKSASRCLESLKFVLRPRRFLAILAAVFMIDGVIIGLALANIYANLEGIPFPTWFDLTLEFAFGEIWEYCLCAIAGIFLLWKFGKYREPILAALGCVFAWLTLDNMLGLHEASGEFLAPLFPFAAATAAGPEHFGELAMLTAVGLLILAAVIHTAPRSSEHANIQSLAIVVVLACSASFGVVLDFAKQFFPDIAPMAGIMLGFLEDGGEMVLISIAAALAISFVSRAKA